MGNGTQNDNETLRTAEVARLLHVSPKTISRWAKEQKRDPATGELYLPHSVTLGGHRRYRAQAVRDLAARLAGDLDIDAA